MHQIEHIYSVPDTNTSEGIHALTEISQSLTPHLTKANIINSIGSQDLTDSKLITLKDQNKDLL